MTCECVAPGFCPRFRQEMGGRLQQICRGENIEPEDAAKFRELWQRQAASSPAEPPSAAKPKLALCRWLGKSVRDPETGRAVSRPCGG